MIPSRPYSQNNNNFPSNKSLENNNNQTIVTNNNKETKDFESEFPSLQQIYKKHYKVNNNNHNHNVSNHHPSIKREISEKDIEILNVFRNEILNSSKSGIDIDCWKKRDLLYYCFIQKPHEIQKISNFISGVANYYQLSSRSNLLDIGCGLGRMFEAWDRSKWQNIDAFEPDRDYYQFSLDHANNISDKVKVYNLGFFELSQVRGKYDMVVSIHGPFQYLIKLPDRIKAVKNIYDSLKPGGVILLDVSNFLEALRDLRPQVEQKMLVNGVPVKRISNITVDTFNGLWSIEDVFYSINENINNNNNNNSNSCNSNYNNYETEYDCESEISSSGGYSENNGSVSDSYGSPNSYEYADGGFVVEQLQFSILSVAELQLLLLSAGFINTRTVSRWDQQINYNQNPEPGPRIIISGQKPLVSQII